MSFDLEPYPITEALVGWLTVFAAVSTAAAIVILLGALIDRRGLAGPVSVFRFLASGVAGKIGTLVGAVAGMAGFAFVGWHRGPRIVEGIANFFVQFWSDDLLALDASSGGIWRIVGAAAGALLGALVGGMIGAAVPDTVRCSPRRVWALTQLTFREAIRRKTLLVFAVFIAIFMFASWFLPESDLRANLQFKAYAATALRVMTWLVIPVVLLLSCWGLPQDIRDRSLHTVVTKPTRRNEVILGRILGFTAVGTLLLAGMSIFGYVWIVRNFPDPTRTRTFTVGDTEYAVTAELGPRIEAVVVNNATGDSDTFTATNRLELRNQILGAGTAEQPKYPEEVAQETETLVTELQSLDEPVLVSRVPLYGSIRFTDREGNPSEKGINVGDIWEFRGYIEGNTRASALWEFDGLSEETIGETLVLASTFEAFRTHKGTIGKGLEAEFQLLNDLRAQTAEAIGSIPYLGPVRESIAAGDFPQAAQRLTSAADAFRSEGAAVPADQAAALASGYERLAGQILPPLIAEHPDAQYLVSLRQSAAAVAEAARTRDAGGMAETLTALADLLAEHGEALAGLLVDVSVPLDAFTVQEFRENLTIVPRDLIYYDLDGGQHEADLFEDLVHGGVLRVRVRCLDSGQFLGMARPDLFIRMPDKPFWTGYAKATLGVWLMMTLVVVLGVTASTFVKGPVATLLVFTLLLIGLGFHAFLGQLLGEGDEKPLKGGFGTIESAVRLIRHQNPFTEMEQSRSSEFIQRTDEVIQGGLWLVYRIVPNFNSFSFSPYVANGFDVQWTTTRGLMPAIFTTLGFIVPCLFIGYYSLRLRELEAK